MAIRASKNKLVHIENSRINDEVKGGKMLHMPESLGELSWRVARKCNGGECVRVAAHGDTIVIGSSEHLDGPVIAYSRDEWTAFVQGVRDGDFDDLL